MSDTALPRPSQPMNFDGERYVSGQPGEIAHEHYLRYFFAAQFCAGKHVLDIASGEGYGSCIIAEVAARVDGTDLSIEAIEFARAQYASDKISFTQGDAREIPHPDASFDVVVSFETLEHIEEHDRFLSEIKRVLRPGGLLIMSTPDRDVYLRDLPPNPFHRREPNREEFSALIQRYFDNNILGLQRSLTGALLLPDSADNAGTFATFGLQSDGSVRHTPSLAQATYLLAVATDGSLPKVTWGVLTDDTYVPDLREKLESGIKRLMGEKDTLDGLLMRNNVDLIQSRAESARLERENKELVQEVARLTRLVSECEARNSLLDSQVGHALESQRNRMLKDILEIFE